MQDKVQVFGPHGDNELQVFVYSPEPLGVEYAISVAAHRLTALGHGDSELKATHPFDGYAWWLTHVLGE